MFCRFGSVDDRRPVAATVWLNVVWMRPSSPTALTSPSTVDFIFCDSRNAISRSSNGWSLVLAMFSSSLAAVE